MVNLLKESSEVDPSNPRISSDDLAQCLLLLIRRWTTWWDGPRRVPWIPFDSCSELLSPHWRKECAAHEIISFLFTREEKIPMRQGTKVLESKMDCIFRQTLCNNLWLHVYYNTEMSFQRAQMRLVQGHGPRRPMIGINPWISTLGNLELALIWDREFGRKGLGVSFVFVLVRNLVNRI